MLFRLTMLFVFLCLVNFVASEDCYWNRQCPNMHYSTKTPYDTVRGDIRDYPDPEFCEAISIWSILRHGNRNSDTEFTKLMVQLLNEIQSQIVVAFDANRSHLCAQDIEELRKWRFNATMLSSPLRLTDTGYREMFDIAKRIRHRYPHLLQGGTDEYNFRPTENDRSTSSAKAYVHGLTDKTNLSLTIDKSLENDHVIQGIKYCQRYEGWDDHIGKVEEKQTRDHKESDEYLAVQKAVQKRLGIAYQLTATDIYTLYDICRYHRTWTPDYKDAWCAVFSDRDLDVLGYQDDIRHYYRNGYGTWISARLAGPLLHDLREHFNAAVRGKGKKIISYFSHNSITLQTFVALGLFRDQFAPTGAKRDPNRLWKSSLIAAFATNMMVVLNRCTSTGNQTHRVQFFINEKQTELCPLSGCTWERFKELVEGFEDSLEFCDPDYPVPAVHAQAGVRALEARWLPVALVAALFVFLVSGKFSS